ncbi:C4-dicarboxylate TRAP transporter substrate-binding protein [Nitratireductor sp. StC3]|uniref:C4-dicarboxylate TRAP transporter substrate-binding protein n=1 Tax=Nitratireductor sp. StC3 TaxID=2126741 RepID=UPI000D0D130D|nr:C4-dicarboxylate TRAP transporter substrate-binding protein [Nitratireductor sp. StC3]PSM17297.1 C4-dicarboxylate ABC transporter permease [Nitratireductor sp. StC3]
MFVPTLRKTMIAALAVAAATAARAETINVTYVAGHPPVFRWVRLANEVFIPAVNKQLEGSGHTINWDEQYGGSLAKVGDELEAVEEGLAEIGGISSVFDPAKLSLQNVTYYTPFVSSDPSLVVETIDALHETNQAMLSTWEENGLEYLGGPIAIDDYVLMTTFPVNSIEDLNGKKIGAPGPAVNWLEGTGAVGVSGNLTTYYNEIKTGVYDGVIVFATAALPGKLHEVAPHITRIGFGAQYAGAIAANKDWFDSQPDAVQKALKDAADTYKAAYLDDLDKAVTASFKAMQEQGATISDVDAEFRQKWAAGMDNVAKKWAAQVDSEGKAGTEILKAYLDAIRAAGGAPVRNWDQE